MHNVMLHRCRNVPLCVYVAVSLHDDLGAEPSREVVNLPPLPPPTRGMTDAVEREGGDKDKDNRKRNESLTSTQTEEDGRSDRMCALCKMTWLYTYTEVLNIQSNGLH